MKIKEVEKVLEKVKERYGITIKKSNHTLILHKPQFIALNCKKITKIDSNEITTCIRSSANFWITLWNETTKTHTCIW